MAGRVCVLPSASASLACRQRPILRHRHGALHPLTVDWGRTTRLGCRCNSATGSAAQPLPEEPRNEQVPDTSDNHQPIASVNDTERNPSFGRRIKNFFGGDKMDMQRLKALGLGAVASYGCVSNVTYGTGLAISWITFVKQTGKSPLMANQWKPFLALYGGFWAAQHFVRPLRFSLALFMAPVFDKFINFVQHRGKLKRQNAFGVYLFLLGSITSISVFGSIRLLAGALAFARG